MTSKLSQMCFNPLLCPSDPLIALFVCPTRLSHPTLPFILHTRTGSTQQHPVAPSRPLKSYTETTGTHLKLHFPLQAASWLSMLTRIPLRLPTQWCCAHVGSVWGDYTPDWNVTFKFGMSASSLIIFGTGESPLMIEILATLYKSCFDDQFS